MPLIDHIPQLSIPYNHVFLFFRNSYKNEVIIFCVDSSSVTGSQGKIEWFSNQLFYSHLNLMILNKLILFRVSQNSQYSITVANFDFYLLCLLY